MHLKDFNNEVKVAKEYPRILEYYRETNSNIMLI